MVSSLLQILPPIGPSFETTHAKTSTPYTINEKENTALRLSKAVIDNRHDSSLLQAHCRPHPLLHTEQAHGTFVVLQSIQSFISLILHTRFPSIDSSHGDNAQGPSSSSAHISRSQSSSCMMSLTDHDADISPKTPTSSIPIPKSQNSLVCQEEKDIVDHVKRFQSDTHSMYKRESKPVDVFDLTWSSYTSLSSFFNNQTTSREKDNVTEASCQPQAQQEAPRWTKTHSYVRDVRSNANEFRMLAAEINMVRASKITRPLRNRHWLEKRHDTFVWGRRTCLRIVNVGEHNKQSSSA